MTQLQKIIKYAAMAFAILLAVGIISGIVSAVMRMSFALDLLTPSESTEQSNVTQTVTFDTQTVTALELDLAASDLRIRAGVTLQVTADREGVTVKQSGDTLIIEEDAHLLWKEASTVTLTLPEGFVFSRTELDAGAGRIEATLLQTERLSLSLGAGEATFDCLHVSKETEIETGAGKLVVKDGTLANLDLELGVGKAELALGLVGDSRIECGVGALELTLLGSETDYTVAASTGVGSFKLDGVTVTDNTTFGAGASRVTVEGGIGTVDVSFA